MVDLYEKIEEGVEFIEAANNPNPRRESGQHRLPADPQDRREEKILWTVGRHAVWTENLAGFQRTFCTSLQLLPDP